jgi:putative ABC transport system permease protein
MARALDEVHGYRSRKPRGGIGVLIAALRDLQWRRRRFIIAVIGTGVVFAMTLILTGLSNGFDIEAANTIDSMDIDAWVIPTGAAGPYLGQAPFAASVVDDVAKTDGVTTAAPVVFSGTTLRQGGTDLQVNVYGAPTAGPGMPDVKKGRKPAAADEIVVSSAVKKQVGDTVALGAQTERVVGVVGDSTAMAGTANVFLTLEGAQAVVFAGQPLASSIAVRGAPALAPRGYKVIDRQAALDDMLRPMDAAHSAVTFLAALLWLVAALIVGSVIYLSALERVRDFAVFKAVGVASRSVMAGLALQAVIVAVVAAIVGGLLSFVLAPTFPMKVAVPTSALLLLPVVGIFVGLVASLAGLRRAVTVDPALAFGGP